MPRINTRHAADYIAALEPFTTNGALSADYDDDGGYLVKSYSTAIAVIYPALRRAILNGAKYSRTTSGHQHAARLAVARLPLRVMELTNPEEFTKATGHRARQRVAG
jgi:hypothetical protein